MIMALVGEKEDQISTMPTEMNIFIVNKTKDLSFFVTTVTTIVHRENIIFHWVGYRKYVIKNTREQLYNEM